MEGNGQWNPTPSHWKFGLSFEIFAGTWTHNSMAAKDKKLLFQTLKTDFFFFKEAFANTFGTFSMVSYIEPWHTHTSVPTFCKRTSSSTGKTKICCLLFYYITFISFFLPLWNSRPDPGLFAQHSGSFTYLPTLSYSQQLAHWSGCLWATQGHLCFPKELARG